MNNTINNEAVVEEISVGVETTSKNIVLGLVMTSVENDNFDFSTTIDELGQIVLTPIDNNVEFKSVNIIPEDAETIPESSVSTEGNVTTKSFCLNLNTTLLTESDNLDVTAIVDDIGQVIIHPVETNNTFLTVNVNDSLNMVTEELKCVEYFGYKLCNNGDGWDVTDSTGNVIETGIATEAEAKILVLTTELHILENLTEDVEAESEESKEEVNTETDTTEEPEDIKAEVISEEVTETSYSEEEIEDALVILTDMFSEAAGTIRCDTLEEQKICCDILGAHYNNVECKQENNVLTVSYSNDNAITEAVDATKQQIINKFLQGNIPLFSDNGSPLSHYQHIEELDGNGYKYYYDEETGAIISYPDVD